MGEIITNRNRIKNKIREKLKKLMMKNEVISTKIVQKTGNEYCVESEANLQIF